MNFLDTYDIARSPTPNPEQVEREAPSLNQEVNEVIGQLGRFWGGFRKQSETALQAARKDLGDVVVQAQKELSKLTVVVEPPKESKEGETGAETTGEAGPSTSAPPQDTQEESTSTRALEASELAASPSGSIAASGSNTSLFARLQSSLPPNIVATVQNNIPESLKHASENIDLQQLRLNLLSDFQRVQGVTRAQAEEYLHKSEALIRDAVKEAGEVIREAVKVVPPEEAEKSSGSGMVWDGTDMWMLPSETAESGSSGATAGSSGKGKEGGRSAKAADAAVATRAQALLKRLKHDPSILRHDPEAEEGVKIAFDGWTDKEVDSKEGGIEGAEWSARSSAALEEPADGQALKELEETLVPSEMTKSTFWLRFFFRSHQIRSEEEKRKDLIHSSIENDEDFSWEDDEDDSSPTSATGKAAARVIDQADNKTVTGGIPPSAELLDHEGPSRRVSSSDSFDLVSSASANVSVLGDAEKEYKTKPGDDEADGDSDWE